MYQVLVGLASLIYVTLAVAMSLLMGSLPILIGMLIYRSLFG